MRPGKAARGAQERLLPRTRRVSPSVRPSGHWKHGLSNIYLIPLDTEYLPSEFPLQFGLSTYMKARPLPWPVLVYTKLNFRKRSVLLVVTKVPGTEVYNAEDCERSDLRGCTRVDYPS